MSRHERLYFEAARSAAVSEFRRAYRRVPAYKRLVDASGAAPRIFSEIPIMTKKNFILPSLEANPLSIYHYAEIPNGSIRDTSTGTSGNPTPWYRGPKETRNARQLMEFRVRPILGDQAFSFINGFALGPWATGITTALGVAKNPKATLSNIGPSPVELLKAIKEMTRIFPERPVVVAGYPPHLQELVELARKEGFSLGKHKIIGVVGGEAMSETQRDLISHPTDKSQGLSQVYSFYGASDLDINVAFETNFEVALRRAAIRNPALAKDLFGEHPFVPMIFHYDPLNHYLEKAESGNLLFTDVTGDRISPRIRYDLGDKGEILPMSQVQAILQKHGVNLKVKPHTNLPLVFVWGRIDNHITYRAANVSPENLDEALQKSGLGGTVQSYGFRQYEKAGNTRTEIMIHLRNGASLSAPPDQIRTRILAELRSLNVDFNEQMERSPPSQHPDLRIFQTDSPMMRHQRENPSRKRKYIFMGKDAEGVENFDHGGTLVTSSPEPK